MADLKERIETINIGGHGTMAQGPVVEEHPDGRVTIRCGAPGNPGHTVTGIPNSRLNAQSRE